MDTATLGTILAVAGGIGGAGMVTPGWMVTGPAVAAVGTAGSGGGSEMPTDDQTLPKQPPWLKICRVCPLILGLALAALLWTAAELRPTPQPAIVLIAASLIGIVGGSAGATVYRIVGSTSF